jgi:hypothetical protein
VKFTIKIGDQEPITRIVAMPSVAVQSGWQIPGSTIGGQGFKSSNPAGFGNGLGSGTKNGGSGSGNPFTLPPPVHP